MIECADCEEYLKAIDKLEAERDEARANLSASREVYKMQVDACLRGTCNGARHPAPPSDAATEAVNLAALPVHFVSVLPRGHIFMHPDTPKSGVRDPWFLSTPAPAPSAKETK